MHGVHPVAKTMVEHLECDNVGVIPIKTYAFYSHRDARWRQ